MGKIIISALLITLTGCGFVSENLLDGYDRGDITEGLKADRAWYCNEGLFGIRRVARVTVSLTTGKAIPDLCRVVDAVVED